MFRFQRTEDGEFLIFEPELYKIWAPVSIGEKKFSADWKIVGRMQIAEVLLARDGRTSVRLEEREIDPRSSIIPTYNGEIAVMRIDKTDLSVALDCA